MSDGQLLVNFPALQQASADISKAISTLDAQLGDLQQAAAPLVSTWEGEAQASYAERQRRWTQASTDLKGILQQIKGALDESAQDYLSTEKSATQLFS